MIIKKKTATGLFIAGKQKEPPKTAAAPLVPTDSRTRQLWVNLGMKPESQSASRNQIAMCLGCVSFCCLLNG